MKKPELVATAAEFGTELDEKDTIPEILAKLGEDGITDQLVKEAQDRKEQAKAAAELEQERTDAAVEKDFLNPTGEEVHDEGLDGKHLIKCKRENPTYVIRGIKFTRNHPYALVNAADAEWITENIEGIVYATPKELQEYYG